MFWALPVLGRSLEKIMKIQMNAKNKKLGADYVQ